MPGRRPASAGLARAIGDRPGAGDRLAGATAVAWAAAPGGASVRERLAAGGADGDDMASAALDRCHRYTPALRGSRSTISPSATTSPPLRRPNASAAAPGLIPSVLPDASTTLPAFCAFVLTCEFEALEVIAQLMSTPAFLAAAVVLGLAGAFALIKHRSKKTIPRLPDAKLD